MFALAQNKEDKYKAEIIQGRGKALLIDKVTVDSLGFSTSINN